MNEDRSFFRLSRLDLNTPSADSECVSCGLVTGCSYVSASFSPSADWYVLSCLGPDIPSYTVRSTRSNSGKATIVCLFVVVLYPTKEKTTLSHTLADPLPVADQLHHT